jgi:hypothetical protein
MIEPNIFNIVGIAYIGNLIAYDFTPIQAVKQKLIYKFEFLPFISSTLDKLLNCSKCLSLWIGTVIFQSFILGAMTALVGYYIHYSISKIDQYYNG